MATRPRRSGRGLRAIQALGRLARRRNMLQAAVVAFRAVVRFLRVMAIRAVARTRVRDAREARFAEGDSSASRIESRMQCRVRLQAQIRTLPAMPEATPISGATRWQRRIEHRRASYQRFLFVLSPSHWRCSSPLASPPLLLGGEEGAQLALATTRAREALARFQPERRRGHRWTRRRGDCARGAWLVCQIDRPGVGGGTSHRPEASSPVCPSPLHARAREIDQLVGGGDEQDCLHPGGSP